MELIERRTRQMLWAVMIILCCALLATTAQSVLACADLLARFASMWNASSGACRHLSLAFALLGFVLYGIFAARWAQALWRAEFPNGRRWFPRLFWLFTIPIVGAVFYLAVTAVIAWRRSRGGLALLTVCAALLIVADIVARTYCDSMPFLGGELSEREWVLAWMLMIFCSVAGGVCHVLSIPLIAAVRWPQDCRRFAYVLLGMLAMAIVGMPYIAMWRADAAANAAYEKLAALGVPFDTAGVAELYFHGLKPNSAWTELADRNADESGYPDMALRSHPEAAGGMVGRALTAAEAEAFRAKLEINADYLCRIDEIFAIGAPPVKYAISFETMPRLSALMDLSPARALNSVMRLYADRVRLAIYDRDGAEVMRLHRHMQTVIGSALDEFGLIGVLTAFRCISIDNEVLSEMLSSGLLTAGQLAEVAAAIEAAEAAARPAMLRGFKFDAVFCRDNEELVLFGREPVRGRSSPLRNPAVAPIYCFLRYDFSYLLDCHRRIIATVSEPGFETAEAAVLLNMLCGESERPANGRMVAAMAMPSLRRTYTVTARTEAELRMARMACDIELFRLRNNRLPVSLSEPGMPPSLPDPFSGASFSYEQGELKLPDGGTAIGYRLSSAEPDTKAFTVAEPVLSESSRSR